jgi:RNA polymerase sigma factor (sigma-70 family)
LNENFDITKLSDDLFRHEAGKLVALLTRILGTENLELSEDVVQETFISALRIWSLKGIPENPSGWLFKAAKNKAIDILRKNKFSTRIDFSDPERRLLKSEYTLSSVIEILWREEEIQDDLLRMMFACCHAEISQENQITLMLKTLCGFSTTEIAKAFLTTEDTVSKRLYRTKNFFRERKIKPEFPDAEKIIAAVDSVLRTIYLIFNEGYNATETDQFIRKDLLEQAMYLCSLLAENKFTQGPEVYAAMALMYYHASRIESRIGKEGEIILLAEQDRTKWDQQMITIGNEYLSKAAYGQRISTYHIEAAIAYEHCISRSFEETNWKNVLNYYDLLATIDPGAVVMFNRLTVIRHIFGVEKALEEINHSPHKKDWEKNYLYHSLLGNIYSSTDPLRAREHYETAAALTRSEAEKKLLLKKAAETFPKFSAADSDTVTLDPPVPDKSNHNGK